jgi:hypothetical protein
MLKKILPFLLLIVGSGAGVGAGVFLRPDSEPTISTEGDVDTEHQVDETSKKDYGPENPAPSMEYAKLNNQFVVPIVKDTAVVALVVLALSIEVPEGKKDVVFQREPKLRDSFLQVLFDHANIGGFDGAFTSAANLRVLRNALSEAGQKDIGDDIVNDVLILEIARQDY